MQRGTVSVDDPILIVRHCLPWVIVHTCLRRYLQYIGASALVLQRGVAQPRIGILQLGIRDSPASGILHQIVDGGIDRGFRAGDGRIELLPFQQEAVALRGTDDGFGGKQAEHVAGSLLHQPKVRGLVGKLAFQFCGDASLSAVVGSSHAKPVTVFLIGVFQVLAGCPGGFFHMIALVDIGVDFEAVLPSGGLHELPHASGSCRTTCKGVQVAFYHGKVFEVIGEAVLFQYRFDEGEEAVGALDGEHGGGVHVGECQLFAVHAFAKVIACQVYVLSGKADFVRHDGGSDAVGDFRLHRLLFRVYRAVSQQERECDTCTQGHRSDEDDMYGVLFHVLNRIGFGGRIYDICGNGANFLGSLDTL